MGIDMLVMELLVLVLLVLLVHRRRRRRRVVSQGAPRSRGVPHRLAAAVVKHFMVTIRRRAKMCRKMLQHTCVPCCGSHVLWGGRPQRSAEGLDAVPVKVVTLEFVLKRRLMLVMLVVVVRALHRARRWISRRRREGQRRGGPVGLVCRPLETSRWREGASC
jgi:hypothetical protein